MTKKLSHSKLHMELDLDSFLDSISDEESNSVPYRTIDEILNESDSSTPTSSPPSPPAIHLRRPSDLHHTQKEAAFVSSTESLRPAQSSVDNLEHSRRSSSSALLRPGELSGDPIRRVPSSSRNLPSLFGGVRANTKPGAALAAAVAASRSVPTPHAAAIKSRRAGSGLVQKVDGYDREIVSNYSSGDSGVVSVTSNGSGDKLAQQDDESADFESALGDINSEFWRKEGELDKARGSAEVSASVDTEGEVRDLDPGYVDNDFHSTSTSVVDSQAEPQNDFSSPYTKSDNTLDDNSANLHLDEIEGENVVVGDEIPKVLDTNDSLPKNDMNGKVEEELTVVAMEQENMEKDIPSFKDYEVGVGGADASLTSDIPDLVKEKIEQLESERVSRREERKSRSSMKPLELAEELEKRQASTGLHWEAGAAAQPMRLEGVRRGSTTLGYFEFDADNIVTRTISSPAFRRDHGSPQVLAMHFNYIAVGMSKGIIVVVPSRYSVHNADSMDASKMLMLGLHGDRSHAPVTSMCFNQQGDLLLAGYADGHATVWDVQKGSAAKVITGEHTAPVLHTLFLGQDSQATRQFKVVTGDCKGLVLLHACSVVPLLNRFSIKTQCLLDGQKTGTVLAASPLHFEEYSGGALSSSVGNSTVSTSSIGSMMGGVVGGDAGWKLFNEGSSSVDEGVVVFVTHQTALVVRLSPTLEVYAHLPKPDGVREGSMPYTAWKCTSQSAVPSDENNPVEVTERVSYLALAWDRKVQVAKLVKSELKVYGKWSIDSPAIGVAWLDDQMLVILTLTWKLYLFAKDGTIIHQTNFAIDGTGGDDLIAYHTHFFNIFGNPEKAYHNCVAVRGASIYVLGPIHLIISRLLPWKERIQVLQRAGDWMGALNMAMTLYDGQAHGVIDLPRSLDDVQQAIMPYLVELLQSYVDEVFSYISVAFCNQIGKMEEEDDSKGRNSSVRSEIKEQYTRVGGVAVEFCVHIMRTDILFDDIYSKFVAVQHKDTFLELLEPYILRDMLGSLPPEIMQALVEHYSSKGWLQRVEQCVLHMDISSLDFNQVVRLCREHGLYGALVYLFNKGLDDFRTPLEELLVVFRSSQRESATALGYRMLVYLKYCFTGLAFPPGQGTLSPARLASLRTELVQFLLENSNAMNSLAVSSLLSGGAYLNLYHLLKLDTEATLDVLKCAFVDDELTEVDLSLHDSSNANVEEEKKADMAARWQNSVIQNTIDALVYIVDKDVSQKDEDASTDNSGLVEVWPSKKDVGRLFEFIAYYVASSRAHVTSSVLGMILEYLTSEDNSFPIAFRHSMITSKRREKQVLALLKVVPETDWNAFRVLDLCEKANFFQVCGLIHTLRHEYLAALDSYMKDLEEPIHAFSFINNTLLQLSDNERETFQSAIISRIPELVGLSREGAFFLILDHFHNEGPQILSELRSHPKSLFLYLKTVIEVHLSGMLNFSDLRKGDTMEVSNGTRMKDLSKGFEAYLKKISDFPRLLRNNPVHLTDDMTELYLELLCQYERDSVLQFLETFDSYRVEHCLLLCQKYGIIDAAAFLLERVGDAGSALLLTLSSLNGKFVELGIAVKTAVSNVALSDPASLQCFSIISKINEVKVVRSILHACIGLCQRNTPRLNPEESETLWFTLLDSFCKPLMDTHVDEMESKRENHVRIVAESLGTVKDEEAHIIKWKISKSQGVAHILKKLFSQFIKEIVEGMMGCVRLPTIMSKLLSDNANQEFGDFKLTILGMLGTYGFERRILDTAKSLIEDDTFYTMSLLKKGASHGYAPQSLLCCLCNCLLLKNSSSPEVRVFNCGHTTHLHCEILENDVPSRGIPSGCPVCMPKKNNQRSIKNSDLTENALVYMSPSRSQQVQGGSALNSHENDSLENSYGLQQISRFAILTNLEKDQRLFQIENLPQLRLAPPALYHEKVKKSADHFRAESSSGLGKIEKPNRNRQLKDLKVKGSSLRFPLKSNIFSKEKTRKH
ncbi:vacuolar protein sorting-associated protein 8 isoform X1 [Tripterygium wilfordii]|uniref:Vacuolar protein sorting-associated protein 8 isoform X1 n=1 Tax=Tripterygium wilfordii TaxID=458696 RepID=A0A7J7CGV0_TRIWF|nr:vacuolar protein sorting-associated protein 8 homolog [Tripterygium wilfordii]KAF5733264.1 vacuolar protein sorting-associated protein 8 isoform X1 [Tripterygium wilfordii]